MSRPFDINALLLCRARRQWLLFGAAVGVFIGVGAWRWGVETGQPAWRLLLESEIGAYRWSPDQIVLERDGAEIAFVMNDLLYRPLWDVEEARLASGLVVKGYTRAEQDLQPTPTIEERSQRIVFNYARIAIEARLEFKAPITPAARKMLIDLIVSELEAEFPERRRSAGAELIHLGEIEDGSIRAGVERLLDDPDPDTVEHIGFLLARYDDEKSRRAKRMNAGSSTPAR